MSEQGTKMGRRSLLHVQVQGEDDGIYIGGHVTPVAEAVMTLESFEGELCRAG
jgi:predicted PhzF superfamily epimerase YddE/YHI9